MLDIGNKKCTPHPNPLPAGEREGRGESSRATARAKFMD